MLSQCTGRDASGNRLAREDHRAPPRKPPLCKILVLKCSSSRMLRFYGCGLKPCPGLRGQAPNDGHTISHCIESCSLRLHAQAAAARGRLRKLRERIFALSLGFSIQYQSRCRCKGLSVMSGSLPHYGVCVKSWHAYVFGSIFLMTSTSSST